MEAIEKGHTIGALVFAIALVLIDYWLAKRAGFFSLPLPSSSQFVRLAHVLGIFFLYFALAFVVLPAVAFLILYLSTENVKEALSQYQGWMQVISLSILFLCLLLFCVLIDKKAMHSIFWGQKPASFRRVCKSMGMGVVALLVSYPFVFLITILLGLVSTAIWGTKEFEQLAVKQLKMTMNNSYLFLLTIFTVVILVPFMEELLFRGFLQSFFKKHLGRKGAIFLTAFIFAVVHFAPSQKEGNFQLIGALFVLACFLGFIYEKEETLWAPIALHTVFNGASVLMISYGV